MIASPTSAPARPVARRKLTLLKQSGLFGADTKGATIRRACTARDLAAAYRLVHDVYLGTGYTRPEPSGIRLRMFETSVEMATFIAEKDGEIVGVLSVVADSADLGLPSDAAFQSELDALRASGKRLCELTNQAVAEAYRQSAVPTELMRCAMAHSMKLGFHESVATVSPGHNGFYEMVGFRRFGSLRSYSKKLHDPVVALTMDLDQYRQPVTELNETGLFLHRFAGDDNHYHHEVSGWAQQAESQFLDPALLRQLFVVERNFLAECSGDDLQVLQRNWGEENFRTVLSLAQGEAEESIRGPRVATDVPWNLFGAPELTAIVPSFA